MKKIGKQTVKFDKPPKILANVAVVGPMESEGPLKDEFDICFNDSLLGEESWEKAESKLQKTAVERLLNKAKQGREGIDFIFAGDLLNQCIASSFGIKNFNIPFVGLYGACSTMALSLINASVYVESGAAQNAIAVTSSHFCSAERQYRFPLEYGGVRPPTSQWTVTGSGAVLLGYGENLPQIEAFTIGKITDLGIKDANNMGAAMAPDDVKIRPYPKGYGVRDLDLFSVVISALAVLKMLEMQYKAFLRFSPCQNKNNLNPKKLRHTQTPLPSKVWSFSTHKSI